VDTCKSCGAALTPDLEWCGRCFAPVARDQPAGGEEAPMWIRTQRRERVTFEEAAYSRWKAGPTSFGGFGRILLTLLLLAGAVVGYPMARGGMFALIGFDIPGRPFMIGYAVVAAIVVLFLLTRIWKRARVA
jgi:hypothetical protein